MRGLIDVTLDTTTVMPEPFINGIGWYISCSFEAESKSGHLVDVTATLNAHTLTQDEAAIILDKINNKGVINLEHWEIL